MVEQEPVPIGQRPTHIWPPQFSEHQVNSLCLLDSDWKKYSQDFQRSQLHWNQKSDDVYEAQKRLTAAIEDTIAHSQILYSSVSVGKAYLRFQEIFFPQGLSQQDIFDFFKSCMVINIARNRPMFEANSQSRMAIARQNSRDYWHQNINPLLVKYSNNIPEWFNGSKADYMRSLEGYSNFARILHFEDKKAGKKIDKAYGSITEDGLPDWVIESDEPPALDVVEKELEADIKDEKIIDQQFEQRSRQVVPLAELYKDKMKKSLERFTERFQILWPDNPSLADIVLYIHNVPDAEQRAIDYFAYSNERINDVETIALWIEDMMKKGEFVHNGKWKNKKQFNAFLLANQPVQPGDDIKSEFQALREKNKKGYRLFQYDLKPILSSVPGEEIASIVSLIEEVEDQDPSTAIHLLADQFSKVLQEKEETGTTSQALRKSYLNYISFVKNFIANNKGWMYDQISELFSPPSKPELQIVDEPNPESADAVLMSEFEEELEEVSGEKVLTGWNLHYSQDMSVNQEELIEISGTTREELSQNLADLIARLNVPCTIKPTSIIQALNSRVELPEEVRYFEHKKSIGGEEWRKIKRGKVRIFYRLDKDSKDLVFFIHQKKDFHYGF